MRQERRSIIVVLAMVVVMGTIFLGGTPSSAQNAPFQSYDLRVFCGDSPNANATATFWHDVPESSMGLKTIDVGNCNGCNGSLADALAGLPAAAAAALKAMVDKHQADAAAGKGQPLTCLGDCENKANQAWDDYMRNLKIVLGLWDDADKEFDRGIEEFRKAKDEILEDMVGEIGEEIGEESLPWIAEEILKKTGKAKVLIKPIGGEAANVAGAGAGVVLFVAETGMILKNVQVSVDNLEYSSQSQNKMRLRADEKWKQVLDDLDRALALDKACAEANAETAAKAKAERKLEERARQYMDENFDNFHKTYRIGSKDYKDANTALEAAKKIIEAHYKGRSGYVKQESIMRLAAYAPSYDLFGPAEQGGFIAPQEVQEAITQLNIAEAHLRRGTTLIVKALKAYRNMLQNLDSIRSRIGTGVGPGPQQQLLPAPKEARKVSTFRPALSFVQASVYTLTGSRMIIKGPSGGSTPSLPTRLVS